MLKYLLIVNAYLLGSIPFGLILTKKISGTDIRFSGSGNIGATNALRMGGKKVGLLTLLFDILKGTFITIIAYTLFHSSWLTAMVAIAAVIGHDFPIFLKFKGGKGVSTSIGVLFVFSCLGTIFSLLIWLGVFFIWGYASLASLAFASAIPFLMYVTTRNSQYILASSIMSLLIYWKHRGNIERLIKGTEKKIKDK
ncbi:MAG: glycerol-3-phosphate 1-O-acyltransferase PlsY [bacterium]